MSTDPDRERELAEGELVREIAGSNWDGETITYRRAMEVGANRSFFFAHDEDPDEWVYSLNNDEAHDWIREIIKTARLVEAINDNTCVNCHQVRDDLNDDDQTCVDCVTGAAENRLGN